MKKPILRLSGRSKVLPTTLNQIQRPMARTKCWCWTLNNPELNNDQIIEAFREKCLYLIFQREREIDKPRKKFKKNDGTCFLKLNKISDGVGPPSD